VASRTRPVATPNHAASWHFRYAGGVLPTMSGTVENILRWFAGVGAAFKKPIEPARRPTSDIAAEIRAESGAEEPRPVSATTEGAVEAPSATATVTIPVAAGAKIGQDVQDSCVVPIRPDDREIQRRRELVRTLFNDFWNGRDDKPGAFVERLDQAEPCLNEQLTACGEFWQLDANTRKMLSLPPRSGSRDRGNRAGHRPS
jgi:hypothetical protein